MSWRIDMTRSGASLGVAAAESYIAELEQTRSGDLIYPHREQPSIMPEVRPMTEWIKLGMERKGRPGSMIRMSLAEFTEFCEFCDFNCAVGDGPWPLLLGHRVWCDATS